MLAFIEQHPALVALAWGLLTAILTHLFKPRSPEEYAALPPRVAAALKLMAALGVDWPKVVESLKQVASGSSKRGTVQVRAMLSVFSVVLAIVLFFVSSCTPAARQKVFDTALPFASLACLMAQDGDDDAAIMAACGVIDSPEARKVIRDLLAQHRAAHRAGWRPDAGSDAGQDADQ